MSPSSSTTTEIFEITKVEESKANALETKRSVGEKTAASNAEIEFLPLDQDERNYQIVHAALNRLQQSASQGAKRLGLKTDDDVFNHMRASKKFE